MLHEIASSVIGVVAILYGLEWIFSTFDDPREPPRAKVLIPFLGHIWGLYRYGFDFYSILGAKTNAQIYTMAVLNYKIYVTYSPQIIQLLQKSKTVTFKSTLRENNHIFAKVSSEGHDIYSGALLDKYAQRTRETLVPGLQTKAPNLRMGYHVLDAVSKAIEQGELDLFQWANHTVIQAGGAALYGEVHPYRYPEVEKAAVMWNEQRPKMRFGLDLFRTGTKAHQSVLHAIRRYMQSIPEDVSPVIRARHQVLLDGGMCEEDAYRMQANFSDFYGNTSSTAAWTIYEVFCRPQLREEIRQELLNNAVRTRSEGGSTLELAALQTQCPLLLSAFEETQRMRHKLVAFRIVDEDTLLGGYLLKKGTAVQVPTGVLHQSQEIWTNPAVFDAHRFVALGGGKTRNKISPSNFLPWGFAPHLCPARQMATTEVLLIVALLILRVELIPDGGVWERDPAVKALDVPTLSRPKKPMHLRVVQRESDEADWTIVTGECTARIPLASG